MTATGRPTRCGPEMCEHEHNYCLLGATDRAVGYDCKVEREVIGGGELQPVASTGHSPPNVQACIFWLRNRQGRTWRDAPSDPATQVVDDMALLDAASESMRHHDGD